MVPLSGNSYFLVACVLFGHREPKCRVPWTKLGSCPLTSRMSISPEAAQPPNFSSCGNIHTAGQMPLPVGSLARNSTLPNLVAKSEVPSRFLVLSLADE